MAEFRAIEEALTGALKFFDNRPSAEDAQRFAALCGAAAVKAAAGHALARGAAPTLQRVSLTGNPASEEAQQAAQDTLKNRN